MDKHILTEAEIADAADAIAHKIAAGFSKNEPVYLHGVPRGGISAAYAVIAALLRLNVYTLATSDPDKADVIIDDLVDSGTTRDFYRFNYDKPFYTLFDKTNGENRWLVFPWEVTRSGDDESADDIVIRMLQRIGENPNREGLLETPRRVLKAWDEWFSGYKKDPAEVLKAFADGAEKYTGDEMVIVKNIPIYSMCEHHLAPFFGRADVGYIPNGKIVGLSKLSRLADIFMRRLQVQERLTNQIADALEQTLKAKGVAVRIECRHMCMESRGVKNRDSSTTTSAMRGLLMDNAAARAEFLSLIKD